MNLANIRICIHCYAISTSFLLVRSYIAYCRPPLRESDKHSIRGVLFVERGSARVPCLQFKCTDRVETCHCLQIIQMRKWFIYNTQSH